LASDPYQYPPRTLTPLDDEYEDNEETRRGLYENENFEECNEGNHSIKAIKTEDTNTVGERSSPP